MIKYTLKTGQSRPLCPVVLFGPPALPLPRRLALLVVVQPSSSSFGPPRRPWALRVVVRPRGTPNARGQLPTSSLDLLCPCSTTRIVARLFISAWGYLRHGSALRVVVEPLALPFGPSTSLLGRSRCRSARC